MKRRASPLAYLLRSALALLLLSSWGCRAPKFWPTTPHVVILLADDLGCGDVRAAWPGSRLPTPHLDRLAASGMTFTDGHAPAAVCTPTRYGLLTGRYCWRSALQSGVLGGYSPPLLEANLPTLGTLLQGRGYRTAVIGKWHLGMDLPLLADASGDRDRWEGDIGIDFAARIDDGPLDHGFDEFFGISASLDMAPYVFVRNDRFTALPTAEQPSQAFPGFVRRGPLAPDCAPGEVLDRLTGAAVEFVRRAARDPEGTPFFLYLPLTAPHKPVLPSPRFRGRSGLGPYGDFVMQLDAAVGEVLGALQDAGVQEQTLVIFTSDNGSYMGRVAQDQAVDHVDQPRIQAYRSDRHRSAGPYRGTKADIYEGGHRVPLLVRWPAVVEAGTRCDETVCLTDVFATLAEIIGTKLDRDTAEDSVSLLPLLQEEKASRGLPVVHHSSNGMFAIREGRWKLILGDGSGGRETPPGRPFASPYQLYDLEADPGEQINRAVEHPERVERLARRLEDLRRAGGARVEARSARGLALSDH